ncbi:MAG: hypothetical protein HYZ40_07155 [Rhodospirillales bacterium]|nr:hypothetical protein [Rhodospirillales bacterium]
MASAAENRVLDLVQRLSVSHPTHWVAVQEVAQRSGLRRDEVDAIVRHAVGKGRMLAEGEPPHRVTLRNPLATDPDAPFRPADGTRRNA